MGAHYDQVKRFTGWYDRSIIFAITVVVVGGGALVMFYIKMGDAVDGIIAKSKVVQEIQARQNSGDERSRDMVIQLRTIDRNVKKLLWKNGLRPVEIEQN